MRWITLGTVTLALTLVTAPSAVAHVDVAHVDVAHVDVAQTSPATGTTAPDTGTATDTEQTVVPAAPAAVAPSEAAPSASEADDLVADLPKTRTDGYGMVGVTWTRGFDDTGLVVRIRHRTDGEWSSWTSLDVESDEGEGGRDGTDPLWIGRADGVAVRVTSPTGRRPAGLKVVTIDPGTAPTPTAPASASSVPPAVRDAFYRNGTATAVQTADGSPTYTAEPKIISRSSWGAKRHTYCDSPRYGNETRGVIVHHTAGSNSYSKKDSAKIVRATQAYHMKGRGWCDIGYNFLVDKYGQIFEGRVGGVDKPVRAAHAGDKTVNTYTMGVSMMGTFDSVAPSAALKTAMVKLIGWRLGTTFHPATGTYKVGKYTLNRIAGHRNVVSTDCPGKKGYAWLSASGGLRARVKAYIADYSSPIKTLRTKLGAANTGPVYVGEYPTLGGRKLRTQYADLYSKPGAGTFPVSGYLRNEYRRLSSQAGVMGFPTSDRTGSMSTVAEQTFEHGRIYRVAAASRAYGLYGKIVDAYVAHGEAGGDLGAPTSSMISTGGGSFRATFQHGSITYTAGDDAAVVTLS